MSRTLADQLDECVDSFTDDDRNVARAKTCMEGLGIDVAIDAPYEGRRVVLGSRSDCEQPIAVGCVLHSGQRLLGQLTDSAREGLAALPEPNLPVG